MMTPVSKGPDTLSSSDIKREKSSLDSYLVRKESKMEPIEDKVGRLCAKDGLSINVIAQSQDIYVAFRALG